jgi:hypothetical protein
MKFIYKGGIHPDSSRGQEIINKTIGMLSPLRNKKKSKEIKREVILDEVRYQEPKKYFLWTESKQYKAKLRKAAWDKKNYQRIKEKKLAYGREWRLRKKNQQSAASVE